ncbi:MAG: SurA N-terminal domain-containing protein [Syntrophales bacterium]
MSILMLSFQIDDAGCFMLYLMRRHAKSWIMKLLLFLIIVVFALYFGSMGGEQTAEAIATVDGKPIAYVEFEREYQNLVKMIQQHYEERLTDNLLKSLNLKQQALDNLIAQAITLSKARDWGISVSDAEVRNSILSFPGFQRDGVFHEYLYRDLLEMNHMTPEEFEAVHKKNILVEKIRELLQSGIFVTDREVHDLYVIRNEKINVQFVTTRAADLVKSITPTTKDMETFLERNGDRFRVPEQIRLRYLKFTATETADRVDLPETEITEYIEEHRDAWQKGTAHLTDSILRNRAISELKQIRGMQIAAKKARDAHDTIYQEENFQQFAAENRYRVHTTDFFPLSEPPREFSNIADFTKKMLDLQKNELSRVMSDETGYYLFELVEKKPAHLPPLKDVESRLKPIFIAVTSQRLAEEKAVSILERLRKGEDWPKVCTANGLNISETGFFLPGESIPKIGASEDLSNALVQLTANNPYPEKPFVMDGNVHIVKFAARDRIDSKDFETEKDNLKEALLRFKQENIMQVWLDASKAAMIKAGRLKISKNAKDL